MAYPFPGGGTDLVPQPARQLRLPGTVGRTPQARPAPMVAGRTGPGPIGRGAPAWALGAAQHAGFFDPYLPSSFLEPIIAQHLADSQARQRAGLLGTQLYARGDPSLRAFAALRGLMGEQGNLARILGKTRADAQMNQLRFLQDLFRDYGAVGFRGGFQ